MESDRLAPLGPWKMYVFSTVPAPAAAYVPLFLVGSGKTILWYVCYLRFS
jgi:hypothetical protein